MTEGFYARVSHSDQWPQGRRYPVLYSRARTFIHRRIQLGAIVYVYPRNEFPHKWAFEHDRQTYGAGEIPFPELVRLTPLEVLLLGNQTAAAAKGQQ